MAFYIFYYFLSLKNKALEKRQKRYDSCLFIKKTYFRMTWVDFVGQIGGLLGLCIGFSLLSGKIQLI